MKLTFIFFLLSSFSIQAANFEKKALKFVPGGMIQSSDKDEFSIKTKAGSIVEIELDRNGDLDEASGNAANNDVFVPGQGLLSLNEAVKAMAKEGKIVQGEWSLDKDFLRDWEYEFEGMEDGKQYEYSMNAKTGKLIGSEAD